MANKPILDVASWYDPLFEGVLVSLRDAAARIAPPRKGLKVLDIGCGTGAQLAIYLDGGSQVYGIDLSPSMLRVARSNLNGEAGLVIGNALLLPHPDGEFDLVLSSLFLHQLSSLLRSVVLKEAVRVLQPGGQILLIDFNPQEHSSITEKLTYYLISTIELFAGREHFRNSRDFLSRGGIPHLAASQGLIIEKTILLAYGNLGVYLLRQAD